MPFAMKVHAADTQREVVAVCDGDLIGRTLNGGEKDAEFKISEEFYGKKEFAWEEVAARMRNGRNINLVGNVTVEMAVKEGLVNADSVIEIEGIKHAQVYSI